MLNISIPQPNDLYGLPLLSSGTNIKEPIKSMPGQFRYSIGSIN